MPRTARQQRLNSAHDFTNRALDLGLSREALSIAYHAAMFEIHVYRSQRATVRAKKHSKAVLDNVRIVTFTYELQDL